MDSLQEEEEVDESEHSGCWDPVDELTCATPSEIWVVLLELPELLELLFELFPESFSDFVFSSLSSLLSESFCEPL